MTVYRKYARGTVRAAWGTIPHQLVVQILPQRTSEIQGEPFGTLTENRPKRETQTTKRSIRFGLRLADLCSSLVHRALEHSESDRAIKGPVNHGVHGFKELLILLV